MATGDPDSARALRPLRRLTLPGGRTLLRAGLVAALLGLAAAVLHTPTGCPPAVRATPSPGLPGAGTVDGGGPTDAVDGPRPTGTSATTDGAGATSGPLPLPSGAVGVPVRLAEPAALAVVRPGARVDLLAAPPGGAGTEAALLAPGALVLDVLGAGATDGSSALYLALRPDQAQRAVGLPEGSRFAIVVRG
ncbi:flagellar biosynthesis protein FlgA [Micromonospora sp. U21]|uniref:flagellar biosynthesis protein FlgA n=1 Tax=Micromonospora sp. U21 TaxID=2824899 RepID=UPI001B37B4AF|nr:flagellar biosynthesis protein FlgA [Micromonospora sp. U21]MBQ0904742.1 flagellar biosynthesis protein FlgA [Micromonospora sp. U21]